MIRWGIGVLATILILVAVALSVGMNSIEKPKERRQPTEAERIIAYCKDTGNKKSPLCAVDPEDPAAVRDAVRQILERQTTGPQVIERERETVRVADDDDDTPQRVEVNVPRSEPTSQPSPPQPTQPPMVIPEAPDVIPEAPDVPNVDLPLLP